jgi:TonB family protein
MSFALSIVIKSTIVLICAAACSILLRRSSASTRHAAWLVAMGSVVVLPAVILVVPQFEWAVLPQGSATVSFITLEQPTATAVTTENTPPTGGFHFQPYSVWMLGAALLTIRFALSRIYVRRLERSAAFTVNQVWVSLMNDLCSTLGIQMPVRLLFGDADIAPMTWGIFRHTILLPSTAATWPEERRRVVLAHELAHVKRNDGLAQSFAQLVCSVYWFNPLVWFAAHRARIERERACDDHVLRLGTAATDYADHLIQIVRGLRSQRALSATAVSIAQPSQLETRLLSILDPKIRRRTLSKTGVTALVAFVASLTISIAAIGPAAAVAMPPVVIPAGRAPSSPPAVPPVVMPPSPQRTRIGNAGTASNPAVVPPKVLESARPMYTPEALAAKVEGIVTLEGSVDVQGKVSGLRVIKGLGYGLDRLAIKAVEGWKFGPALRNGQAVEAITQIEVDFRIPQPKDFKILINAPDTGDTAEQNGTKAGKEITAPAEDDAPAVRMGAGVTPPRVVFRVEPQYTPEAREAKQAGTVVVTATIHQDGSLTVSSVVRGLENGLTEKAIEALESWKFQPGMKDGKPVPVMLNIEVNFNLR